jgi:hypothetical protein
VTGEIDIPRQILRNSAAALDDSTLDIGNDQQDNAPKLQVTIVVGGYPSSQALPYERYEWLVGDRLTWANHSLRVCVKQ